MAKLPAAVPDPVELLARRGLRATRQRVAVLRGLLAHPGHPSAPELHRRLLRGQRNLSQKTVYEALDALVEAGLAARLTRAGSTARYEARRDPHYHASCRVCGSLFDIPASADGAIRGRARLPDGFAVESIQVTIEGVCQRCGSGKSRGRSRARRAS
jgi:Fe2+ or Zn2+ uptake regulation protein